MKKPRKKRPAETPAEMYYEMHQEMGIHLPRPLGDGLELLAFWPNMPTMKRRRIEKILKYAAQN